MKRDGVVSHSATDSDPARTREALWERRVHLEKEFQDARDAMKGDVGDRLSRSRIPEWALRAAGLWHRGVRNALNPALVERTLRVPHLPEFLDGFRLLHVSDFHFKEDTPEFAQRARDLLAGADADLCVLTGDYRYSHRGACDHVFHHMATVLEGIHCEYGILGILGNHDLSTFVEPFETLGIGMIVNANRTIALRGERVWIAGVDDHHRFYCDSLPLAMDGIPPGEFTILLAHSPELAAEAPAYGIQLYLCGHTHWGQVRLPGIGALTYNSRCPARFCEGEWRSESMVGYTTAGIGVTDLPIRYNCPPEACVLTLLRA